MGDTLTRPMAATQSDDRALWEVVCDAIIWAYRQKPRTELAAAVMALPTIYLATKPNQRIALHMRGYVFALGGGDALTLALVCAERLNVPRSTFEDRWRAACRIIASELRPADRALLDAAEGAAKR
jgi:hypothetical protein